MKKIVSELLAGILVVSLSGCASAPVAGGTHAVQIRPLSSTHTAQTQMLVSPLPQYQPGGGSSGGFQAIPAQATVPQSAYWTGDGGKGKSITILPPRGVGLEKDQAYLPDLVANELVGNFRSYSAMTLFDRVNNQKQYDELLSGFYADDDKAGLDLGHLASTDYMLMGDITKTSSGYTLHLTVNRNSDKTTLATYSGTVSIAELDNLIGIRRASLELLQKMGVQITAQARTELTRAATSDQVNALTAMAQGIAAQRQGTEVAALTYFFQAAAFDASLVEAVSRTTVLSTNISTGNIGANVRNDFAWNDSWKAKLTETETFVNDMLRNTSPQRSIWYSNNVREEESARNYNQRTTELRIEAVLHTHAAFPVSVQKTVQAVYDGLQTTGRAQAWGLNGWPQRGVTNANPFNSRWGSMIPIAFEVLNERGQVIGRQTVEMDSRYSFSGTRLEGPGTAFATVRFTGVKGDDITDRLSIRIASINGRPPTEAGISRIEPMSSQQIQASRNFTIYNGAIRPSSNSGNLGTVTIPAALWGERVSAMAFESRVLTSVTVSPGIAAINDNAFANSQLTSVTISPGMVTIPDNVFANTQLTSVSIPSSVTSIGTSAFANNRLTSVTIPNGVTTIGDRAFADNQLTSVTIPSSVTSIGASAFANNRLTTVTIPEGVSSIGERAFADNHWTTGSGDHTLHYGLESVTIANSVSSIGQNAFASHGTTTHSRRLSDGSYYSFTSDHYLPTEVTIGTNVNLGTNAIGNGFETFYANAGRQAGIYRVVENSSKWEIFDSVEAKEQAVAKRERKSTAGSIALVILSGIVVVGGAVGFFFYLKHQGDLKKEKEEKSTVTPSIGMRFAW